MIAVNSAVWKHSSNVRFDEGLCEYCAMFTGQWSKCKIVDKGTLEQIEFYPQLTRAIKNGKSAIDLAKTAEVRELLHDVRM